MKVFIRNILFFLLNILFIQSVSALKISEIMYDPLGVDTGREWIEIYNDESNNLSIGTSAYKFYEAGVGHGISGTDILLPREYAIIVDDIKKFKIDNPNYIGPIYSSSFILSNSGEILSIRHKSVGDNEYKVISEINYTPYVINNTTGTACDINVNGASGWGDCISTPGKVNEYSGVTIPAPISAGVASGTASSTTGNVTTGSTQTVSNSVAVGVNYYVPNTNIYLRIGNMTLESQKEKKVIAGTEIDLVVRAYDDKGIAVRGLKYYWSMGDGGYFEGENIKYTYHMPGDYEYTVEAGNDNSYSIYRGSMHVYDPKIKISSLGTTSNYLIIKNDIDTEMDIGGYLLRDNVNNKTYKIPRNTFIKANKELKLIGAAMGFISTSSDNFTLSSANGILIHQYFPIVKPIQSLTISTSTNIIRSIISTDTSTQKTQIQKVTSINNPIIAITSNTVILYSHSLRH